MDIDLLSKMVKEIILDNDRVVLPGLGCFVAELVPSTFSDKGYTINPPYRRLYFRANPSTGDELVRFYARSNKVEVEMADRIISDFVAELKSVLHAKKMVVFPGLGRLRATKENSIFFVADEDLDIYPDGFGLEPISLKTNQETAEEVSAAVVGLKNLLEETVPVVEPVPEPTPKPISEPAHVSVSEPVSAPKLVPESGSVPEPISISDTVKEVVSVPAKPRRRFWKRLGWTVFILIILAAFLFAAFLAISRISPEFMDSILYSKEELEILNYNL